MSFGLLGLQFGWALRQNNLGAIDEPFGTWPWQTGWLWIAAPLTGLIVQPIVGAMSDRTWGPLGRRRPYFLAGAVFGSLALLLLSRSPSGMTACLLWALNASIDVSLVPLRALVVDKLPESQRARGFAVQGVFISLGAVVAGLLPWIFTHGFGVPPTDAVRGSIPPAVRSSFYLGAAALLGAVLWTAFSTSEPPPDDPDEFRRRQARRGGFVAGARTLFDALGDLSVTMRRLAAVQFCTWLGLCCWWISLGPAVARHIFGAVDTKSALYTEGIAWANLLSSSCSAVAFFAALALVAVSRRTAPKVIHTLCLLCGAAGLLSVGFVHDKYLLFGSMIGVGIAWASTLSMPYALLTGLLPPERTGVCLGLFNLFIVLPEILAALGLGWVTNHLLNGNRILAVMTGGMFLLVAAILMQGVPIGPEPITSRADEDELTEASVGDTILPA